MPTIDVRGVEQLANLAKQMRKAGQGGLRRELVKELRAEAKPVATAQKSEVRGLAGAPRAWKARAASMTRVKISTSARSAGVRISVGGGDDGRRARYLNRGKWRHPLFGNKEFWYVQQVEPGWFDRPADAAKPGLQQRLINLIENYVQKLGSRL